MGVNGMAVLRLAATRMRSAAEGTRSAFAWRLTSAGEVLGVEIILLIGIRRRKEKRLKVARGAFGFVTRLEHDRLVGLSGQPPTDNPNKFARVDPNLKLPRQGIAERLHGIGRRGNRLLQGKLQAPGQL